MLQQDFLHFRELVMERFQAQDTKMDRFMNTMNSMMGLIRQRIPKLNDDSINPFGGETEDNQEPRQSGIYSDPLQAARERDRPYDQEGALKHLKLAFPIQ